MRTPVARSVERVASLVVLVLAAAAAAAAVAPTASAQFVFEGAARERVGRAPKSLVVADFDEDGLPDAVCGDSDDTVSLLRNESLIGFVLALSVGFPAPSGLVSGDWNEDGHADLAVTSETEGTLGIFLGDGTGSLAAPSLVSFAGPLWDAIGADFDGDGRGDLAVIGGPSVTLLWGDGSGAFPEMTALVLPPVGDVLALRAADLDGDGALELVAAALPQTMTGAAHVVVLASAKGEREFRAASDFSIPLRWPADIVAHDLNGDGRVDLLFTSFIGDSPQLLLGSASAEAAFEDPVPLLGPNVLYVAAGDFDRDGASDIAATGGYPGNLRLFGGNGAGGFTVGSTIETGGAPRRLAIADLDGDARDDVATANWRDAAAGTVTPFLNRTVPACRGGSVNRGAGAIADVLFVNDSAGAASERTVRLTTWEPLFVFMAPPPLATRPAAFALFAWPGAPSLEEEREMPHGIGVACRGMLAWQGGPRPVAIWNNTGVPALGRTPHPSSPAPHLVFERRSGAGRPMTIFLQGVIEDPGSAGEKPASVTNGVVVEIR